MNVRHPENYFKRPNIKLWRDKDLFCLRIIHSKQASSLFLVLLLLAARWNHCLPKILYQFQ